MRAPVMAFVLLLGLAIGCGSTPRPDVDNGEGTGLGTTGTQAQVARERPPESGPARDVSFPPIVRSTTASGLEVNSVEWHQLPVVYVRLVIKSGAEADPAGMPGMAHLVGAMLKEGTRSRTSAQLAEEVAFLGADLWVGADEENVHVGIRALSEQLDDALAIVADVATNPAFRPDEVAKLKRRELDRLALQNDRPTFLAARELYRRLYGQHPYAEIDTNPNVVRRIARTDMVRWHRQHFVPNNAALIVVGDVTAEQVSQAVDRAFRSWRAGQVPAPRYAAPPARDARQVLIVDRPESVQSVVAIGNLAIERSSPAWVPLQVADQVLGGSAGSRLFMDLRERRSLTYGAYSDVGESVQVAPFQVRASVRNEVTGEAVAALFEHLDRIRTEPVPGEELANARRYLSDRFPLQIDTPGKIASMVADLRIYGLPDDYWDGYRTSIGEVTSEQVLEAARADMRPDQALVVVVGRAAEIYEPLRRWGPVTVVTADGEEIRSFESGPAATPE